VRVEKGGQRAKRRDRRMRVWKRTLLSASRGRGLQTRVRTWTGGQEIPCMSMGIWRGETGRARNTEGGEVGTSEQTEEDGVRRADGAGRQAAQEREVEEVEWDRYSHPCPETQRFRHRSRRQTSRHSL
jgi:hypothetical protein